MSNIYFVMVFTIFIWLSHIFLSIFVDFFCFSLFYRDYTVVRGVRDFFLELKHDRVKDYTMGLEGLKS